ncbi:hypothetical protein D0Z03_002361 [Geotrichum reessii]|nr:hypothetical protein D0Z03_002361 [Galactomyces reessii]
MSSMILKRSLHLSSTAAKSAAGFFQPIVHSAQGYVALAGSTDDAEFAKIHSESVPLAPSKSKRISKYATSLSDPFYSVGSVQTASNIIYSNKHSE